MKSPEKSPFSDLTTCGTKQDPNAQAAILTGFRPDDDDDDDDLLPPDETEEAETRELSPLSWDFGPVPLAFRLAMLGFRLEALGCRPPDAGAGLRIIASRGEDDGVRIGGRGKSRVI